MLTTNHCDYTCSKRAMKKSTMSFSLRLTQFCSAYAGYGFVFDFFLSTTRVCWFVIKCSKFKFNCFQMLMTFFMLIQHTQILQAHRQFTEIPDHLHDLNSHAVFQIVKILHSKTMVPCFKNIVLLCRDYFTIQPQKSTASVSSPFIKF